MRIVGLLLVRNEERFVERVIRNVAGFCDEIYAVDHVSDDSTWEILRSLSGDLPHLQVLRSPNSARAHRLVERFAGTETWVLGVDGDELYDPLGLAQLRGALIDGAHGDVFRVKAHVLNCDHLDEGAGIASGWLAPPSRPITKLFNFACLESWTDSPDPLQAGRVVFKPGFHWESRRDLASETTWETDPLRCLHLCFVRRSSCDPETFLGRRNLDETREFDRSLLGKAKRVIRRSRPAPHIVALAQQGRNWKREWYARGDRVRVDARPFLSQGQHP
ncbi:MAG: hypothetical protein C4299_03085 [Thermoleophilia bacterium]